MRHWLWKLAFWWLPKQRTLALVAKPQQRTPEMLLRDAIIHVGINRGSLETARLLRVAWLEVKEGPEGQIMDEMYAERMLDDKIH